VLSGVTQDVTFEVAVEAAVVIDEIEIGLDASTNDGIGELFCDTLAMDFVGDLFAELGEVTLAVGVLDVTQEIGALSHEVITAAQEIAGGSHTGRVDVSLWDHAGAQQARDFSGIDAIVFNLGAVDGPHVEGVTEDEVDVFELAEISKPVPGEHALDGDDDVVTERFDGFEKGLGLGVDVAVEQDVAVLVEDTEIHGSGMQVDAAVEFMLLGIESHEASSLGKR